MRGPFLAPGWLPSGFSYGFSSSGCSAACFTAGAGFAIVSYAPEDEEMSEVEEAAEGEAEDATGSNHA